MPRMKMIIPEGRNDTSHVHCPDCGGALSGVIDSRPWPFKADGREIQTIMRRRACPACDARHTTFEVPAGFIAERDQADLRRAVVALVCDPAVRAAIAAEAKEPTHD